MQERLHMLQDLMQVTLKLRLEFETEADLQMRAADECEEQKRKRTEAERLVRDFQDLWARTLCRSMQASMDESSDNPVGILEKLAFIITHFAHNGSSVSK
ncbi:hypothetical protein cypCar_00020700 [Cyprinus carpio]|nr:hypothetical protein cypCar_00020700 [Cyprinus carpio]